MIGYLFIIALELVLAGILAITMQCDYLRIKKKALREIVKAKLWGVKID